MAKFAKLYLSLLGIWSELVPDLAGDIAKGIEPQDSGSYPPSSEGWWNSQPEAETVPQHAIAHVCTRNWEITHTPNYIVGKKER